MPHGATLLFSGELDPLAIKGEMTSRPLLTVPTTGFDLYGTNELAAAAARPGCGLGTTESWVPNITPALGLCARSILSLLPAHALPSPALRVLLYIL